MVTAPPVLPRRYSLVRPLGRGGQGTVYLVKDAYLDHAFLALKILDEREAAPSPPSGGLGACSRPEPATPDVLSSEFLVLSRLAHPSLARVRDFGRLQGGGTPFFTSDYAPGEDLLRWGLEHPFARNWPAFYSIAAQALSALHAIHAAGYVHGDVKPAHLIIAEDPQTPAGARLTLIDFGGARPVAASCADRRGTPAYLPAAALGAGPEADLYALGMSLFHSLTGRLPFALGDPHQLDRWRRAGLPARPGDWIEEVPRAAAELIERLTAQHGEERFRAAAQALEFLERRTSAGRALPTPPSSRCPLVGRNAELEEILTAIGSPGAPVVAIAAPPGLGKSRLIEETLRRAQLLGYQTVHAGGASPGRALEELCDLLPDQPPSLSALTPEGLARAFLERAGSLRILVALDGVLDRAGGDFPERRDDEGFPARAWEALVRGYLSSPPPAARLILATSQPGALRPLAELAPPRWREVRLRPLPGPALRAMAVDFFRTASIPGPVVDRLWAASAGAPDRAREELAAMAAAGARTDLLGMLRVPDTPSPASSAAGPGVEGLPPLERLALAVAALSPHAIDAAAVARTAPLLGSFGRPPGEEEWELALESLYWKGQLARAGGGHGLYQPAPAAGRPDWLSQFGEKALHAARGAILAHLRRQAAAGARDPDLPAALARAALQSGECLLAARAALRAARRLRMGRRVGEALGLLREISDRLPAGSIPFRTALVLSLREAGLALHHGQRREAEEAAHRLAALIPAQTPRRWRARSLTILAEIDQQAGRFGSAVAHLEEGLGLLETPGDGNPPALWFEASGRLASLYFSVERPGPAAALLERGAVLAALLDRAEAGRFPSPAPPGDDLPRCARALSLFGTIGARHGGAAAAVRLLEASRRLAREAGRSDLEAGPLHELALIHAAQGRSAESERALRECERLAEVTGERSALLRVRVNLATLYQKRGELDRAEELFLAARVLADEVGEEGPAAASWMGLAISRLERGELVDALRLGRGIHRRFRRSRPAIRATAHFNLGEIYLSMGRPEVARRHRARSLALARACDYRFLLRFGMVGLAGARWAVGDSRGAERRLAAAFRLAGIDPSAPASPAADHHLGAAALLYLGLALGRDPARSARALGRAMFHARRAVSRTHLERALLGLVEMLLARGDRARAVAILGGSAAASPGRHRFLREALALRSGPGWTAALPRLLSILDRAEEAGHHLDALVAAEAAIVDPAFDGRPPAELLARREILAGKFARHASHRDRSLLRERAAPTGAAGRSEVGGRKSEVVAAGAAAGAGAGAATAPDPLSAVAARWASGSGVEIEAELERLRSALPVRALWVLNDPRRKEPMFYGCGEGGPPLDLFSARSELIERVRRDGVSYDGEGFAVVAIPGEAGTGGGVPRVLYAELAETPASRVRLELAAGLLGCFFRVQTAEAARRADRSRLRESTREVHRLNAIISGGKGQVETALITQRLLVAEDRKTREAERFASGPVEPVVGSRAMRDLLGRLRKVAAQELPVLLVGEHGVGKDLLARSIHWASPRRNGPFVSEVCTVPESLLESELFGFVRGAFTDAVADRPGLLQLCSGGTLYLDEISEMSAALQSRLLKVIEERAARPLGAEAPVALDFRLVSSTSVRLSDLEDRGLLRRDLFYRIRGEVIEVPPLRERREEIPALVKAFVAAAARESGVPPPRIPLTLLQRLARLEWPGNIRQLENSVRRAFVLDPRHLTFEALTGGVAPAPAPTPGSARATADGGPPATDLVPLRAARLGVEKDLVVRALTVHGGNASRAARALRITRRYLGILLDKHRIRLADFSPKKGSPPGPPSGRRRSDPPAGP